VEPNGRNDESTFFPSANRRVPHISILRCGFCPPLHPSPLAPRTSHLKFLSSPSILQNPLNQLNPFHLIVQNTWHTSYAPTGKIKVVEKSKEARHAAGPLHLSRKTAKGSTRMRIPPPHLPYTPGIYTFPFVSNTLQKTAGGGTITERITVSLQSPRLAARNGQP